MKKCAMLPALALLVMSLLAAAAGLMAPPAMAQDKPIVLKAVCAWPPENIVCFLGKQGIIDQVNRMGEGKIKIDYIGGPEVLSPFDMIPALQKGSFDVAISTGMYYAGTYKLADVTSWVNTDKGEGMATDKQVLDFTRKYFREKTGIEILGFSDLGTKMLIYTSDRPVRSLGDFKGLKIRTVAPNFRIYTQGVGAASVQIAAHELLTGLERGVVDGAFRGVHQVTQFGEAPYYKFALDESMVFADGFVYVSGVTWKKLPQDVRDLITRVADEWQGKVWKESTRLNEESLKVQREKYKIEITQPSPELSAKIKELRMQVFSGYTSDPEYGAEIKSIFGKYYE